MSEVNREQIEYWNGNAAQSWVDAQERLDATLSPVSEALLHLAAARAGERVVDVGCGCGETSLALASTGAAVWGIDISAAMLEHAEARARHWDGPGKVAFARTDAATQRFTPDHELVFSRFGVMFFADPRAAFANLRTALTPHGRLCFVCWQGPERNPWIAIPGRAVQPLLPPPEEQPDPRAPGPFAFAEPDYVNGILEHAGFADIDIAPLTVRLQLADDLEGAITLMKQVGPLSRALLDLPEAGQQAAVAAVRDALAPYATATGVSLGAACWLVSARASSPGTTG